MPTAIGVHIWILAVFGTGFLYAVFFWGRRPKRVFAVPSGGKTIMLYLSAVILLGALLRLPFLFFMSMGDEQNYIYAAKLVYDGCRQYTCFFLDQPPLYPHVTSIIFGVFGVGLWQAKLVPYVFSVLSIPLIFHITSKVYGPREGLFSAALFSTAVGVILYTATASLYSCLVFFTLLAYAFLQRSVQGGGVFPAFLAGICVGVASMYRLFGPLLVLSAVPVIAFEGRRGFFQALSLVLGFILSFGAIAYFFYSPQFVFQVFFAHGLYESMPLPEKLLHFLITAFPFYLLPFIASAVALGENCKNKSALNRILLIHSAVTLGAVFILNVLRPTQLLMQSTYLSVPLTILAGSAVRPLDKVRLNLKLALLSIILVILLPYFYLFAITVDWTNELHAVAKYVARSPDKPYDGDLGVAFLGNRGLSKKILFIDSYRVRAGVIKPSDYLGQPKGSLLVTSEVSYDLNRLNLSDSAIGRDFDIKLTTPYHKVWEKK